MDILWFLEHRLQFVWHLYRRAGLPFKITKRKIDRGSPPFVDGSDPEDASEPAFVSEWSQAEECIGVIGHLCLSLVHAALFVFLRFFIEMMQQWNAFGTEPLTKQLSKVKGKSLFHKYQTFCRDVLRIDWTKGPVDISLLEQMNLARDEFVHPDEITAWTVYQSEEHLRKYPNSVFADELWTQMGMSGKLKVDAEKLRSAITTVREFCQWLDYTRNHYSAHLEDLARNYS